jgi:DNA-directed RNA polymerase subunit RPC12/RpoP
MLFPVFEGQDRANAMEVRCPNCRNRTGYTAGDPDASPRCPSCGHEFSLKEIDLPSPDPELVVVGSSDGALNVNEEAARPRGSASVSRAAPAAEASAKSSLPYDPGFREAVEAGHLTVLQATARGDRMRWASKLVEKHDLSMAQALLVTDNKATLASLSGSPAASSSVRPRSRSSHWAIVIVLVCIVLISAAVTGWLIWRG